MAWPTDDLVKTELDANTDSPLQARVQLEALLDKVKLILADPTDANTVNSVVKRDGSGNFTAGTITATSFVGALTGDASTVGGKSANSTANNLVVLDGSALVPSANLPKATQTVFGVVQVWTSAGDLYIDTV